MANSANSDQLASSDDNWSWATLFANTEHIQNRKDKGSDTSCIVQFVSTAKVFFVQELIAWNVLNSA